jgi:Putative exonuclease SbcCD, C subunit
MALHDELALFDGEALIEPAGHPERFTARWRLVGAGLANVWRYGDLHLDALSGRLLLRGPNGTGKTTALEALWPYLLDLNPQRLAAGKARPTSLALLMREGANGNKRRCGYVWMTLAAPGDEGQYSYGVRLLYSESGSPAVRVTPFTTPGVPLRNVPLYGANRAALSAEQFTDAITSAGGIVFPDEDAYVAHLATRVWTADNRELLELANRIRAVRNPTLLGDVSPRAAADALRDALPCVSDDVISATAEALAESEATREAFQRDRDAAAALDRFADAWAGHVVEVVATAHAATTKAIDDAETARRTHQRLERELHGANLEHEQATTHLTTRRRHAQGLDAKIRALEESDAYKAAGRLTDLQARVEAEKKTASTALAAFRDAVTTSQRQAEALRKTAEDLSADLEEIFTNAGRNDSRARPDHPVLRYRARPRETYLVDDTSVDPGPGTVIEIDRDRIDALADSWQALARHHRARADAALLALTDRRATDDAEHEARDSAEAARKAGLRAEEEQQRLAREANATHTALRHVVDAVDVWYTDNHELAPLVETTHQDEHPEASDDERAAWQRAELSAMADDEPAQALADLERIAGRIRNVGESAATVLRYRGRVALNEIRRLRDEQDRLRAEAQQLRDGKLLPVPRPDWAGPAPDGNAFVDAIDWQPTFSDPVARALIETALAASGLLGAALLNDGAHTDRWHVDASDSTPAEPSLSAVLIADAAHPLAATAREILGRVPLRETAGSATGPYGLVIGHDGTFAAGPLHGQPLAVDAPVPSAEHIGAAQRRSAALTRAAALEAQATALDDEVRHQEAAVRRHQDDATMITHALRNFPSRSEAARAEATRAAAAIRAAELRQEAEAAASEAAERAEIAQSLRLEWERRTRSASLPIDISELTDLRDDGTQRAGGLDESSGKLRGRIRDRLDRLAVEADDDLHRTRDLTEQHARTVAAVEQAAKLAADHQALLGAVGLNAEEAVAQHTEATNERAALSAELVAAEDRQRVARDKVQRLTLQVEHAAQQVDEALAPVAATQRTLRTLLDVPGVPDVLFEAAEAVPSPVDGTGRDDRIVAFVGQALTGRRPASRRLLRERYDTCRAELAGLWTLDPGDSCENLETYVLTHDGAAYPPPAAAHAGRRLRDRAQAALNKAEESALRDFVIGRLPLAIGTAWVSIEDWIKDVNRKMKKAAASSGVGVRISKTLVKDLSAAELTVYRLACKESTLTAAQQSEVGEALQALITAADGATMTEQLTNAIDIRRWLDISYEIVRPDGQVSRWTSKTGLSGGERRLVVLAPMLAAVAAFYDQLDLAGLRLAALDEVPAEVDERGREGLARYIAELDLDLICTSYLWDGAPGAWDGVDAWDLEAGPDTTVVAFPMLVRGLHPLPGDAPWEPT